MPCSEPQQSSTDMQAERTAKAIVILFGKLGLDTPQEIKRIIRGHSFYGTQCNKLTRFLCEAINTLSVDEVETIIFNAHDRDSRFLANWYEDHLEKDKSRKE